MNVQFEKLLYCVRALKNAGYTASQVQTMSDEQLSLETVLIGVACTTPSELTSVRKTFILMNKK